MILGYTTGVFDLFHIGHLNILRNARSLCDKLIVGITTDELVGNTKSRKPVIPFTERCEIVRAIRYVDAVIAQTDMDKIEAWKRIRFDVLFVGDDWYNHPNWINVQAALAENGVRVVYFPYTKGTSSTLINNILVENRAAQHETRDQSSE